MFGAVTHYFPLTPALLQTKAEASAHHHSQYPAPPIEGLTWVAAQAASGLTDVKDPPTHVEGYQAWF